MVKPKTGKCKDCSPNTPEQPMWAGRCQLHYWQYRASLKTAKESKPRTQIKKVSSKREKVNKVYKVLRDLFMKDKKCEAQLPGCTVIATECHHSEGRGANMLDTTKFRALCHNCHAKCTEESALAIEKGLSNRRNTAINGGKQNIQ